MEDYIEMSDNFGNKGKRGKGHRPKSTCSRSSHSSTGTNELPPISQPESPLHKNPQKPKREKTSDSIVFVKPDSDMAESQLEDVDNISEDNFEPMKSDSRMENNENQAPRKMIPMSQPAPKQKSLWSKLRRSFGKSKSRDLSTPAQTFKKTVENATKYNQEAQDRRMRIVMQMLQKTEELSEQEYDRHKQLKQQEKEQHEIEKSRMEERLFKQVARGQLQCDNHEKTLVSLNHLLKMERQHDDSMITSICDIVLQKPEMRHDLMMYVRQEHKSVQRILEGASDENPANLSNLQSAMAEIQQNSNRGRDSAVENFKSQDEPKVMMVSEVENRKEKPTRLRKKKSERADTLHNDKPEKPDKKHENEGKALRKRKSKSKLKRDDSTLETEEFDTKAKTPAYPTSEHMINSRYEESGKIPTAKIEDKALADYVKTLENTVDDKLRVLLDTHSNRTDSKMAGDTKSKMSADMKSKMSSGTKSTKGGSKSKRSHSNKSKSPDEDNDRKLIQELSNV